jgi:hypothetical protein
MKGLYTAQQIIDEALAGIEDFERNRFKAAAMYFGRGYREWNLYHSMQIKDKWIPLTDIFTVPLPQDYLNYISIGISIDGEVWTYTKEDRTLTPTKDPLRQELSTEESEDLVKIPSYGYNTKSINLKGYFKVDVANNRIVLKEQFLEQFQQSDRDEILLRYTSTGIGDGEGLKSTFIPGMAANMLIAYIEWRLVQSRPKQYSMNYIQDKKADYLQETVKFDVNALPNIDELYDMIYESAGQSVRRF